MRLLEVEWDTERKGICEQIPPSITYKLNYASKPIGDTEQDDYIPEASKVTNNEPATDEKKVNNNNIMDLDSIFGIGAQIIPQ